MVFYADTSRPFFREVITKARPFPPARGPCWGVVQLVGHLTVNEDGEGSNPSAPAKLTDFTATYFFHFYQKARFYQLN